jgi:hypothetical protein
MSIGRSAEYTPADLQSKPRQICIPPTSGGRAFLKEAGIR